MINCELKKVNNYKEKYLNEQKINKVLKDELNRQKKNYEVSIKFIEDNYKNKIHKLENEHNFKIKSIEVEYNKLKDTYNKSLKESSWSEYLFGRFV